MMDCSELENILSANNDKNFLFVIPGGNHGDYLIYFGLHALANKLGLQFDTVDESGFLDTNISDYQAIYVHGGGGFNSWCSGFALKVLKRALMFDLELVIQGPCSLEESPDYLDKFMESVENKSAQRFILFARESKTYGLLDNLKQPINFEFGLNFDTALYAQRENIENTFGPCSSKYRLYALREDGEQCNVTVHDFGSGVRLDPARYCKSFEHWIKIHACASEIVTTRTHSAVIGAILGKKTTLYPGSYHKNRSVWEYSLKDMGVLWGPDTEGKPALKAETMSYIPAKIRKSYKFKQALLWVNKVPLV